MSRHRWKDEALCLSLGDTELFFDKYEEDEQLRQNIDMLCTKCPVRRTCFAVGVSDKAWGVWGGVYLESGDISKEFNKHKTKEIWGNIWTALTLG